MGEVVTARVVECWALVWEREGRVGKRPARLYVGGHRTP